MVFFNYEFHALWRSSDRLFITMKRYLWPYIQFAYANYANYSNYSKNWLIKCGLLSGSLDKTCSRGGICKTSYGLLFRSVDFSTLIMKNFSAKHRLHLLDLLL